MGLAGDYLKRLATEVARLLALLAASTAWAAPAYLAFVLRHDPHVAVDPDLLAVLARADTVLMLLAPVLAVTGAVVVSHLLFDKATLDVVSAIAAFVVITVLFALGVANRQTPDMLLLGVVDRVQAFLVIGGIAVTGVALWGRSPLTALVWVSLFAGAVVVLWTASQAITGGDPDLTRGFRSMAAEVATEFTVWAAAFGAFFVQGYRSHGEATST